MNRHLLTLTMGLVAGVAVAVPANAPERLTQKQGALMGIAVKTQMREQMISRMIVKLRNPAPSELARPMSAGRVRTLSSSTGVAMQSVRAMAGNASLLSLDTPLRLSEAKALAARLSSDPAVAYAEPDIILKRALNPNEPRFAQWQWNLSAPSTTFTGEVLPINSGNFKSAMAAGGANLPDAWDLTQGLNTVTIAIIDTGIVNHPDLNNGPVGAAYVPSGRFKPGYDFISSSVGTSNGAPPNFVSNDLDGRDADPSDPGDWVTTEEETAYPDLCDDGQTGPQDSSWHGSHMAGVAAATTNNSLGIAGIGWNVNVVPIRALGKCGGSLSDIAEAIVWAAGGSVPGVLMNNANPADAISLSLGGGTCGPTLQAAVDQALALNRVVVAATGNEGAVGLIAPADCNGVIAVTAHTINGDNADYANVGGTTSISAPGGGTPTLLGNGGATDDSNWVGFYIPSTILFGPTDPMSTDSRNRTGPAYAFFTGTSPATPHVAGVASLIKSLVPTANQQFIKAWLTMKDSVTPHPAGGACVGAIFSCGKGILNARKALDAAVNRTPAVVTPTFLVVTPNSSVSLVGTEAAFPPANIANRQWTKVFGPAVTLANANTTTASFTAPSTGVFVFEFAATDNLAKTGVDRTTVRVNSPPVLGSAPPAQSVTVGQTVTFTATATDADGTTPTFNSTAIPTGATLTSGGQFTWDTTGVAPGAYQVTYVASDPFSNSSPATVNITVNAVAPPPTGGAPPPTGGGGGGGATPLWQLALLASLMIGARIRRRDV